MSDDTPIYDATCRAVGRPPGTDRASAVVIDEARPPSPEVGDDPSTSELWIPGDALSSPRLEGS